MEILGIDTEDNQAGAPDNFICMGVFNITKNQKLIFFDREEARNFLKNSKEKRYIFCHNLAYDINNLDYPELDFKYTITDVGIIAAQINNTFFYDTSLFFKTKLKKVGEILNIQKLDYNTFDLKNKTIDDINNDDKNKLIEYCIRDAEITAKAGEFLIKKSKEYKINFKNNTLAGLTYNIFKKNFLNTKLKRRSQYINNVERMSYYGGRTEVFNFNRFKNIFYEDINSSYPSSMLKDIPDPNSNEEITQNHDENELKKYGVSLVKVKIDNLNIPLLPYRTETKKLIFPVGEFYGIYTHAELNKALQLGYEIKIIDTIIYNKKLTCFKPFVDVFYEKKLNSINEADKYFYKLILNSLYGKFAERRYNYFIERIQTIDEEFFKKHMDKIKIIGDFVIFKEPTKQDTKHTFPIISSYITSYSRLKLYEERLEKSDNIYYCDTDSVFTSDDINYNRGEKLGQWKLEHVNEFQAFAPKIYLINQKMKLKGIPSNSKKINNQEFEYMKPLKIKEAIRRRLNANLWVKQIKKISLKFDKRVKNSDGTTSPIKIKENYNIKSFIDFLKLKGV